MQVFCKKVDRLSQEDLRKMEIQLPIPIEETIKKRHSVRTYASQALSSDDRKLLSRYMERLDNPFGVPVTMHIIDKALNASGEKLGTYGIIKGATTFLGVSVPDVKYAPLAAGYTFENLILCATHMGLGTVWLAATFNRDAFSSAMDIPPAALFPAISPVGYPAAKPSITESLMRSAMKSSARKEWNALFFQADFVTPLTLEAASAYASALEMVRLAPSAKNAQPWRVRKDGNIYHFYVTYPPKLSRAEILIKQVDLGIAISHFHQTALEQGLTGTFETIPQDHVILPQDTHYMISWCDQSAKSKGGNPI